MSDNKVRIVDLIIRNNDGNNFRAQFPVDNISAVETDAGPAVKFDAAPNPSDFQVLLPILNKDIVSALTYLQDASTAEAIVGEVPADAPTEAAN